MKKNEKETAASVGSLQSSVSNVKEEKSSVDSSQSSVGTEKEVGEAVDSSQPSVGNVKEEEESVGSSQSSVGNVKEEEESVGSSQSSVGTEKEEEESVGSSQSSVGTEKEVGEAVGSSQSLVGKVKEVEETVDSSQSAVGTETEKKADKEDIEEIEHDEAEHFDSKEIDVAKYGKKEFVDLAENMLHAIQKSSVKINDVRNIDAVYKEMRSAYDELHGVEIEKAKAEYIKTNSSDDGFAFKNDNFDIRFESLMIQLREGKQKFYKTMDALRENYFERKTHLLQSLREVVDAEEKGGSRANWEAFKKIQNSWRDAGNVNSPHNGNLWSAYNALLDRYFDIRSIQNELKELDRKKNLEIRAGFVTKIEGIAADLKDKELSNTILKKANEYLNEYKHTGPGPRKEQEVLWDRMKAAFDIIYDKRRGQNEENNQLMEEIYGAKSTLVEKMKPFAEFKSDRINDWNAKTKEVQEIQNQWNNLKGPMPRAKAKEISKHFWKLLKDFFKGKSAFFHKLEAERKVNLTAKEALCEQVESLVKAEDVSADNTNKVIALQKEWKNYGHVPQKFKDSIYARFKKSCDGFFDLKRASNKEQNKEFDDNLKAKVTLCDLIEKEIKDNSTDLNKLADYKKQYNEIGFVPRGDMNKIQKRFVDAINNYIQSSSIDKDAKDKMMLRNEVEISLKTGGNPKAMQRQEGDLTRKLRSFEDEVTQLKTNIEFFGRSAGAEKIKAEYQKKIDKVEVEAAKIKEKLKIIRQASY